MKFNTLTNKMFFAFIVILLSTYFFWKYSQKKVNKINNQVNTIEQTEEELEYPNDDLLNNLDNNLEQQNCSIKKQIEDIESLGMPNKNGSIDLNKLHETIVLLLSKITPLTTKDELRNLLHKVIRTVGKQFSNPQLLYGYRIYCVKSNITPSNHIVNLMQKKTF